MAISLPFDKNNANHPTTATVATPRGAVLCLAVVVQNSVFFPENPEIGAFFGLEPGYVVKIYNALHSLDSPLSLLVSRISTNVPSQSTACTFERTITDAYYYDGLEGFIQFALSRSAKFISRKSNIFRFALHSNCATITDR